MQVQERGAGAWLQLVAADTAATTVARELERLRLSADHLTHARGV